MLEELEELFGSKPSIQILRKARTKTAWTNLIRQYRLSLQECTQSLSVQLPSSLGYSVVLISVHYAQPGFNSLEGISLGDCFIGISHLFPPQFRFPPSLIPPDSASTMGARWLWADISFIFCPSIQTWTKYSYPDYTWGIIFKRTRWTEYAPTCYGKHMCWLQLFLGARKELSIMRKNRLLSSEKSPSCV